MILPIVFFAYTLEAFEVDEVTSEYDSIYRYNALENKVDFYKIGSDTTFLLEEYTIDEDNIKSLEAITEQQINSIEKSDHVITILEGRSAVQTFFLGNDLGVLKFQLVQMKDQGRTLNALMLKTNDNSMITQINSQIDALEQQRAKVNNFILERDDDFSVFGWLISSL
ncbi:hypothetical protein A2738_00735 [Candidatus Nomurabacteria bacterium RIFCSPHIGHO2_01_FULL_42_15]|uniref:Uncharacterized protein n=1 Tax=Candidatus Nomurabacteria bacterium RIFCSPHIGHO2_01_FULL_42_15 TaxID=1801742 RepID=A0A1F6VFJ7_9BACT|nr:MAG: hypothetical protein A2738_00735 [Candidatus Nomurabacteria bacterium RIFCSPHIGHO2_01_FULL_42_15]OGI93176.1 MAG: hypothetical protein A3A99_01435 [Candidatus Nomurabacteria bacterium RIFCSPLOWO2_01_FULL_41_18]